jgi:hypothetical protein
MAKKTTVVRLQSTLEAAVKEFAREQNRSVSNALATLAAEALAARAQGKR